MSDKNRMIISYIEEHKQMTTSQAAEHLNIKSRRARQIFREMIDKGMIEKVGNNRYTYYVLK